MNDIIDRAFENIEGENNLSSDYDIKTNENANKHNQLVEKTDIKGKKNGMKRIGTFVRSFLRFQRI